MTLSNYMKPLGEKRPVGRPVIEDGADMKNPLSAGRRRANNIAKIPEGYLCEWTMLEFAGGGPKPIVGCVGNMAMDLHHGPDKATLNNEVGINLHRICKDCHNRWHTLNDPFYGPDRPADNNEWLPLEGECEPHDRHTVADAATVRASDRWWKLGTRSARGDYRHWSTQPVL
jgi:hypothetical protein